MFILIRNRQSGVVEDVELFRIKNEAIEYAVDYWSNGTFDTEEEIRWGLSDRAYYEDDNHIITLHQKAMR